MEGIELQKLLEETGATTVERIYFDTKNDCWTIRYKETGCEDCFELFSTMYDFLSNG